MSYDFDYYSGSDIRYPEKPVKPRLERNPTAIEARAFADALEEYEREFKAYQEDKSFYQSQASSRKTEFKDKLKKDYDLSDEEFDVIWSEAYDRGHSGGLSEVYSYFDSLYDFVHKYMDANKK